MVTSTAAMAVVRAARPVFRCTHDGIAFAANAVFLADGYSLCAVGPAALTAPLPADEEEVGIDGWNSMDNCYAFLYSKEEEGKKKCILMKCVVIDDFLAIDALDLEAHHKKPCHVQINVKDFFCEDQPNKYKDMYKNFTGLTYPPVDLFGHDDTFPASGAGFYPHSRGTGGSMHIGPNYPCFFPSNPSTPFGDPGSVPPGGRNDPIGPPDVPGFEPSRSVRRSRHSRHSGGNTHPNLEFF